MPAPLKNKNAVKPEREKRRYRVVTDLTLDELKRLRAAARGRKMSDFIRDKIFPKP